MTLKLLQASSLSLTVNQPMPSTDRFPTNPEFDAKSYSMQITEEQSKVVIERWRRECSGLVFLQKTQKLRTILATNTQNSDQIQENSTFTFGSSLLNIYMKLSLIRGPLAPLSISLQIPRVLMISNRGTDLGISVRKAFESDDLQAIHRFFSQRLLTPATIVTYTQYDPENEGSLLGVSSLSYVCDRSTNLD
jgi:hypothetical protein